MSFQLQKLFFFSFFFFFCRFRALGTTNSEKGLPLRDMDKLGTWIRGCGARRYFGTVESELTKSVLIPHRAFVTDFLKYWTWCRLYAGPRTLPVEGVHLWIEQARQKSIRRPDSYQL